MNLHKRAIICLICFTFFWSKAFSAVKLPYLFSDNMVLQQQSHPLIWGWSTAGVQVSLVTSWNKEKITVTADSNEKWKANVTTPAAGGPFEIKISEASNSITIKNVLIGEVWLCSGQSNMEMQMKGYMDQPILGASDAIFNSSNDKIRLYTVPKSVQREVQDNSINATWKEAQPKSVSNFSAKAYYFGRLLYAKLKVPIGLVCNSYGGTPIEGFMDEEALTLIPNVTMDIGNENFIHPWDKETVGKRLAYMALSQTYGLKGFPYASPLYESVSFAGNVLRFNLAMQPTV